MRLRAKNTRRPRTETRPLLTDWTTGWSQRDWADLPTWHPAKSEETVR
jgi:hypothetical protein